MITQRRPNRCRTDHPSICQNSKTVRSIACPVSELTDGCTSLLQSHSQYKVIEFIPHKRGESLVEYAGRMADQIDPSKPFVLIGTSMGGMISMEINRLYLRARHSYIDDGSCLRKAMANQTFSCDSTLSIRAWTYHLSLLSCLCAYESAENQSRLRMYAMAQMLRLPLLVLEYVLSCLGRGAQPDAKVFRVHGTRDLLFTVFKVVQG